MQQITSARDDIFYQRVAGGPGSGPKPKTIDFAHNPEKSENFGNQYGQDIEPHGRYIVQREKGDRYDENGWETGTTTFNQPYEMEFGGGYDDPTNWKHQLSEQYGGATGAELTQALKSDGYDAIMTHDKYGPSEIVDLRDVRP
jgi:hypothetical protein